MRLHRQGHNREHLPPPRRKAGRVLSRNRPRFVAACGLPSELVIHTGLHDSCANSAYHRSGYEGPLVVLSAGTWIVELAAGTPILLPEEREAGMNYRHAPNSEPLGTPTATGA